MVFPYTFFWWGKKGSCLRNFFSVQKSRRRALTLGTGSLSQGH